MKYKEGEHIDYILPGVVKGKGIIRGIATTEVPFIGNIWIVEDLSKNFPNETYPYSHFACPESYLFKKMARE
jgi:hypothetical protein